MKNFTRIGIAAATAFALAANATMPAFAQAATPTRDSGATSFVAKEPTRSVGGFTANPKDTDGGTAEFHMGCGPHSGSPFTPCDEDFIRFCTILGGNSEIEEPEPGIDPGDPSGSCDVPEPEIPEPHD
ncbi:MAG: hypothetical protein AB7N24_22875 [Dehalococcoidia bacterium]